MTTDRPQSDPTTGADDMSTSPDITRALVALRREIDRAADSSSGTAPATVAASLTDLYRLGDRLGIAADDIDRGAIEADRDALAAADPDALAAEHIRALIREARPASDPDEARALAADDLRRETNDAYWSAAACQEHSAPTASAYWQARADRLASAVALRPSDPHISDPHKTTTRARIDAQEIRYSLHRARETVRRCALGDAGAWVPTGAQEATDAHLAAALAAWDEVTAAADEADRSHQATR